MNPAGSRGVPLAVLTAQASWIQASIRFRHTGARFSSPAVMPEAVVVSAYGPRNASLLQRIFASSALNLHVNPNCCNFSMVDASRLSPIEDTVRRAPGDG